MPTRRYYVNNAPQQSLSADITSGATTLTVTSGFAGWPATFPFYATIDFGSPTAEVVLVTALSGTTATITRGQDNTPAVSHPAGAVFLPTGIAKDLDEANAHTSSNANVHGISGNVLGDSDAQTITNKTFDTTNTFNQLTSHGQTTVQPTGVNSAVLRVRNIAGTANEFTVSDTGDVVASGTASIAGGLTVTGAASIAGAATASGGLTVHGDLTEKRGNKVNGAVAMVIDNQNFNVASVPGDGSTWHYVTATWDTLTLNVGDLVDHHATDGSIGVTTPGLYEWHVVTDVPVLGTGKGLAIGVGANQLTSPLPQHSWVYGSGRNNTMGRIVLNANDRVNVVYVQNSGSNQNVTPVRFSLALVAATN